LLLTKLQRQDSVKKFSNFDQNKYNHIFGFQQFITSLGFPALSYTRSKKFSLKNKNDLGMACHIPALKKAKKQGEMPLPSLGPIPLKKCRI